jgi:MFS-type transporter involved in bile tolerance (Atg22 family)
MHATTAGLLLTMMPFAMAALAPTAGRMSDRIGSRMLSTLGLLVLAAGLGALSTVGLDSPLWLVAGCLLLAGAGMAIFQTPNTSAVLSATPRSAAGVGSAFVAEARNMGMAIGIALTAGLVALRMGASSAALTQTHPLADAVGRELVSGMALAMRVSLVLVLVGAGLSWFFRGNAQAQVEQAESGR